MRYKNERLKEPYIQQNTILKQILMGYPLIDDLMHEMEKATYQSLLDFKDKFMTNLRF